MTRFFISIVALILTACSNQTADKKLTNKIVVDSSAHDDTTAHLHSVTLTGTFSIPTKFFFDMVSIFDSAGFRADTNRIKKVGYYSWTIRTSPVFVSRQIPFYKMDTTINPIFDYVKHGGYMNSIKQDSPRKKGQLSKAINKVKTITGFYFTEKKKTPMSVQTDGFIEEWEFFTVTDAQSAEIALTKADNSSPTYYFIYFNSFAQIFRKDKYLYTYYSRADWDGKLLEKLYGQVIKKTNPDSWTKVTIHY